jgi:hypothetical protein
MDLDGDSGENIPRIFNTAEKKARQVMDSGRMSEIAKRKVKREKSK